MAKFWLRFSCTDMDANDWITVKRLIPEECLEYAGNKINDMKEEVMAFIEDQMVPNDWTPVKRLAP